MCCMPLLLTEQVVDTDIACVDVLTRGDLSSLCWIESPLKYASPADLPDHRICHVHYTALNFRDIMIATGKLPADALHGMFSWLDG